jgi:Vitamin K epoxide reductase family
MMDPSAIPLGWSYSPSSWAQRLPIIAMGVIGFLIARYLAAYQLGHVNSVWDPFFSGKDALNGAETIITSDVSKAWPIPDGGLGAVAYMLEILMAAMGGRSRWRTMPWMVTFFGILVELAAGFERHRGIVHVEGSIIGRAVRTAVATSGKERRIWSCCCSSCVAWPIAIPGSEVGINREAPSNSGGMN